VGLAKTVPIRRRIAQIETMLRDAGRILAMQAAFWQAICMRADDG
jgi:hypothetical protein